MSWNLLLFLLFVITPLGVSSAEPSCQEVEFKECMDLVRYDVLKNSTRASSACLNEDAGDRSLDCSVEGLVKRSDTSCTQLAAEKCSKYDNYSTGIERPSRGNTGGTQTATAAAKQQPKAQAGGPAAPSSNGSSSPSQSPSSAQMPQISEGITDDTIYAQSEAAAAIAACQATLSRAQTCCSNPLAPGCSSSNLQGVKQVQQQIRGGVTPGGQSSLCQQYGQLSQNAGSYSADLGGICVGVASSCSSSCQSVASQFQMKASMCSGCASASIYQTTLQTLNALLSQCSAASAMANNYGNQAVNTGMPQAASSICNERTGFAPQSASANDPYGCQKNPGSAQCVACSQNPNSPQCVALSRAQTASAEASVRPGGFINPSKSAEDGSGFNPQPMTDNGYGAMNAAMNMQTDAGGATTGGKTIPGNSGSQIPGESGGKNSAQLDGPKKAAAAPPGSTSVTDIMNGNRSGGGYTQPQSNDNQFGGSKDPTGGGRTGRGLASVGDASDRYLGVDLRKYLPGHEFNHALGGFNLDAKQINGMSVDMFKKVSNKFMEKCRLELWECN